MKTHLPSATNAGWWSVGKPRLPAGGAAHNLDSQLAAGLAGMASSRLPVATWLCSTFISPPGVKRLGQTHLSHSSRSQEGVNRTMHVPFEGLLVNIPWTKAQFQSCVGRSPESRGGPAKLDTKAADDRGCFALSRGPVATSPSSLTGALLPGRKALPASCCLFCTSGCEVPVSSRSCSCFMRMGLRNQSLSIQDNHASGLYLWTKLVNTYFKK